MGASNHGAAAPDRRRAPRKGRPVPRVQHRKGRGIEDDGLSAALAIRQEQTATLDIDVLPPQVENFPQAAAREEKQPKRRRRRRIDLGGPRGLGHVLSGGLGFVHPPRDAGGLSFPDRAAQPFQFLAGQEPFAAAFLNLSIPRAGLVPSGTMPARPAKAYMLPTTASTRLA